MRSLLIVGITALLCLAQAPASAAGRTLRIATEGAYPPFNYVDQANEPAGFEVELGGAICAAIDATCSFLVQDWDGMVDALKARRFDAIMSSMEITTERRRKMAFSDRYYRIPSALIGRKSGEFTAATPTALAGRSIGTVADSEFLAFLETDYRDSMLKTYDRLEEATLDLLTERIDYVLGDRLALAKFLESREGAACCRLLGNMPVDRGEGFGVGIRKADGELVALFNKGIAKVMADGTYDRIRAKYFSFDIK